MRAEGIAPREKIVLPLANSHESRRQGKQEDKRAA